MFPITNILKHGMLYRHRFSTLL